MRAKSSVIGLDLGTSSIKIVRLTKKEHDFVLSGFIAKEIPRSDDPSFLEKQTISALKELIKEVPIDDAKVVVSYNSPETALRVISSPPMPKKELKEAVRLEAARYFPFPVEEALIELEVLETVTENDAKKLRVAAAASPLKTVYSILSLLKKAGIRPNALVPAGFALSRLATSGEIHMGPGVHALLDLGEQFSELVILKDRRLVFSRKIPFGGRDFTEALTKVLASERGKVQLRWDEAEKIKREVGFPKAARETVSEERISASQITSLLRTPLEQLAAEIDRSFEYYGEESGEEKIHTLTLLGGGAHMHGLAGALAESLGVEVKTGEQVDFAAAVGAGRAVSGSLNLLPPEIKEASKRTLKRVVLESTLTGVLLVSLFIYLGMKIQLANFKKRLAVAQYEIMSIQPEMDRALAHGLASQVLAEEPYWDDVFKELSNLVPSEIYLTRMELAAKRLKIKGMNTARDKELALSNLIRSLGKGIFNDVKLDETRELSDKSASEFELSAWVD